MYISLALVLLLISTCTTQSHFDKILLQNVDTIVLREGQMTNARRVSPIPQLSCVGGSAGCRSVPTPNLVICSNIGSQGGEVRWECEADFDQRYRFGRIQVSCEGYEHPNDPYILKDSCGLEYEIDYEYSHSQSGYHQSYYSSQGYNSWFSLTNIILFAAIGILIYAIYRNSLDGRDADTTAGTHTGYTDHTATPTPAAPGAWGNFMGGMFVGGIASFIYNIFSSMFRPRHGYGYGYGSGYGYRGGMSGWGGGARRGYGGGWGGSGHSSGGGSTSRKSAFGGTSRR